MDGLQYLEIFDKKGVIAITQSRLILEVKDDDSWP